MINRCVIPWLVEKQKYMLKYNQNLYDLFENIFSGSYAYHKSSIKRGGAYSKLDVFDAALIQGRCLFEGGILKLSDECFLLCEKN